MGEWFGPYWLEAQIGRGGMGEVYRARDSRKRGRVVALKRLPIRLAGDPEFRARFRREAELAAGLTDPHIIPIHDYGEIEGRLFLDMAFVEGVDLARVLAAEATLTVERTVTILAQVARALDSAHRQGLTHRDVKPSNVLLLADRPAGADEDFVYLIDFGIARDSSRTRFTATGVIMGTAAYMAPEQFVDSAAVDPRADVYALGCVLYEALTGQPPFPGGDFFSMGYHHVNSPPPRATIARPGLPAQIDEVISRALAKRPDERYLRAVDLARAARAALADPVRRADLPGAYHSPSARATPPPSVPSPSAPPAPQAAIPTHVPVGPAPAPEPTDAADNGSSNSEGGPDLAPLGTERRARLRPVPASIVRPEYVGKSAPARSTDPWVQPPEVIEAMRVAGRISAQALAVVGEAVRPGVTTDEIDRVVHEFLVDNGAYPSVLGYRGFPKSCTVSPNAVICHGVPDSTRLEDGDVVGVDVAAFIEGVHASAGATFLAGDVDQEDRLLVERTREAAMRAIKAVRPGREFNVVGRVIESYSNRFRYGVVRDFTGHGIGRTLHPGLIIVNYDDPTRHEQIESGITFTVEPMITRGAIDYDLAENGWAVTTKDKSRSALFKHTVLATDSGSEILTALDGTRTW